MQHIVPTAPNPLDIGMSRLVFEPPDTCFVTYVGDLDDVLVAAMNAALREAAMHVVGSVFLLVDLSHAGSVSDLGRQQAAGGMLALRPHATAVFGASFHVRVVVELITKATNLLQLGPKGPVAFFATEKEARAWLAGIRLVRRHEGEEATLS